MAWTFLPGQYGWRAPTVESDVIDEPDRVDASGVVIYDHLAGRLGSDARVRLSGSDDSTRQRFTVNTELRVEIPEFNPDFAAAVVTVVFQCQEYSCFSGRIEEEYGPGEVSVTLRSTPYVVLPHAAGSSRHDAADLHEAFVSHSDGPFTELWPNFTIAELPTPPSPGSTKKRRFELPDVDRDQETLKIVVGLANTISVDSNDYTYETRLLSHFLVDEISVSLA